VDKTGSDVWTSEPDSKRVLDPRVNFLVVSLMQEVLRSGTGAGARARGFTLPAAGKTGTSNDAWFAGFTSKLICIVWVGLDDYKDLKLDGPKAALPIWAEFMKRAHQHRAYHDVTEFAIPDGIVTAQIDNDTGQLATGGCPPASIRTEYYLAGTAPTQFCPLHGGNTDVGNWPESTPAPNTFTPTPTAQTLPPPGGAPPVEALDLSRTDVNGQNEKSKKGIFDKLKGIFH
jgi:penicillin-binding protein 1B